MTSSRIDLSSAKQIVHGQSSWRLASDNIEAFVTEVGGHLGPVIYDRKKTRIMPLEIAPWAEEPADFSLPPVLRVMRGDFFCMPFGGNETPVRGRKHLPHGETANKRWKFESRTVNPKTSTLHLSLRTKFAPGRVDKYICLRDGDCAVYSRHVISKLAGPMNLGHHAILKFPEKLGSGLISTSPFKMGQVFVEPLELPEKRGYSALVPAARFDTLDEVPTLCGNKADLSKYPARRGFEDIVMLVSNPDLAFAWTAVSFPAQRYVWFALKNPRVLRQTLLWISNGGRHYHPWNGRHINALGLEEVTSYFHIGLAESIRRNPISAAGFPTTLTLDPNYPQTINYIMAALPTSRGFDKVASIEPSQNGAGVVLAAQSGKTLHAPLDLWFLNEAGQVR